MERLQLHFHKGLGAYSEPFQPTGVEEPELLQARAPRRGDGVAEIAVEPDAAQIEAGEAGEHAGGRHGEAELP